MLKIFLQIFLITLLFAAIASSVKINEFTVDPQTDWDGSNGTVTSSDEWIEIYNDELSPVNLTDWKLSMIDGSPANQTLTEIIPAEDYLVILNPTGDMSQSGQLILYDSLGNVVDSVTFGTWNDSDVSDNAPDGNADGQSDECLARIPNGQDNGVDSDDFQKVKCTYGAENGVLPQNEQGLNVTISGKIVLTILPRWLEFGMVQPGSTNNPALNGPIIFNATGSDDDVNVEITAVSGFPFEQGLKIDGGAPVGKLWTVLHSSPIKTAVPTLDIPADAESGSNQGTIEYMITGNPSP